MKKHGYYCKVCGEYKANEKFSGKGHAAHICKKCAALPPDVRSTQMIENKLLSLPCSCEKICPVFPVPRNTVCCPIGKFKVFLCLRWHSVPPFNFVANKKASSPFGLLAMESTLFLFVFCGKLFCRFQQSFKGLLFFRLLNQFYEKCTENIGAVMPGRCGNLVDEVM